mgnify:FL=1|tara:strand:+ start:935 stop:1918 length:984 start_codon:yes stop_codon:yes gene_type:complete
MAILRGGKRIGGYDVRIGIPRDRSLDDVAGDKRLQRRQGGNPATTIGRFQSYVNEAEGFARKARFYAEFNLPKGISDGALFSEGFEDTSSAALEKQAFPSQSDLLAIQQANGRRVRAFCSSISMPEREMTTKEVRHGNAPARNIVYDMKSAGISATFYADKFMRERSYFELWQKSAMSTSTTFNTNYYENYVSNLNIFQLGQYASRQERDDVTYGVQLIDCFPSKIGAIEYSHDANNVQTIDVDFSFRYWINYFIDKQGNIELGSPIGRIPEIKNNRGIFGSLINKLPPELRRAGRDVLNDLRRRVPLGRVTGGRVFPPFKIPPLNI